MKQSISIDRVTFDGATLWRVNLDTFDDFYFPTWNEALSFVQGEGLAWLDGVKVSKYTLARHLGIAHAIAHASQQYYEDAPLSGEWAGMSAVEILGDIADPNESDTFDWACDAYEEGYDWYFSNYHEALMTLQTQEV